MCWCSVWVEGQVMLGLGVLWLSVVVLASRVKPCLEMQICDFCHGALLKSRIHPCLDMQSCDFCCCAHSGVQGQAMLQVGMSGLLPWCSLTRWPGQAWTCQFVSFVVVLTLGRGEHQVWTCRFVTFVSLCSHWVDGKDKFGYAGL